MKAAELRAREQAEAALRTLSVRLLELQDHDQAMAETRTISHLLHPPLLDENGFASAARWYVGGFAKRSGVQTRLDLPEPLDRLPSALELVLFRVLQESLTNVHRHSKSLRISRSRCVAGTGLAGMRERIHELGGGWKWIQTVRAPRWWPSCRARNERVPPKSSPPIEL